MLSTLTPFVGDNNHDDAGNKCDNLTNDNNHNTYGKIRNKLHGDAETCHDHATDCNETNGKQYDNCNFILIQCAYIIVCIDNDGINSRFSRQID